jgi:hypothetical protein
MLEKSQKVGLLKKAKESKGHNTWYAVNQKYEPKKG